VLRFLKVRLIHAAFEMLFSRLSSASITADCSFLKTLLLSGWNEFLCHTSIFKFIATVESEEIDKFGQHTRDIELGVYIAWKRGSLNIFFIIAAACICCVNHVRCCSCVFNEESKWSKSSRNFPKFGSTNMVFAARARRKKECWRGKL